MNRTGGFEDAESVAAFLVGNLFPDIRYLGEVSREATHEVNIGLRDISESVSPFQAGCRLHACVDEIREGYVVDWQIYPYLRGVAEGHEATLLKLIEDELLFDRIDRPRILNALMTVIEGEMSFGVSHNTVCRWHRLLKYYFTMRPSELLKEAALEKLPLLDISADTIRRWSEVFPELVQQSHFIDYVYRLEDAFTENFRQMCTAHD